MKSKHYLPESPDDTNRGQLEGILPTKKMLTKIDILKIFFPQKFRTLVYREYLDQKAIGRSYFYRLVDELEREGFLQHVGGTSPKEFRVTEGALERLSLLSGIPTSKGNIPSDTYKNQRAGLGEIRLHNILFVVPVFCPTSWLSSNMKKEGWTLNAKGTNLKNVGFTLEKYKATIQFFKTKVLIRLCDVVGSNAYVNQTQAMDQYNQVVEELQNRLPKVQFYRDLYKYSEIPKNPPMMYFENGIPNHPIPVYERSKGINHKVVQFNNGKSEFFSDNSVGPELDIKGDNTVTNTDKLYNDLIYTVETLVGVPELHEKQMDIQDYLSKVKNNIFDLAESTSIVSEQLKKNNNTTDYILRTMKVLTEKVILDLNKEKRTFEPKKSLFKRIITRIGF